MHYKNNFETVIEKKKTIKSKEMKKLILIIGLLFGMISCLENEEAFELENINYENGSGFNQKEMVSISDTIRSDNPVGADDDDDDPAPTGIKDGTKKEKQNDSVIIILP